MKKKVYFNAFEYDKEICYEKIIILEFLHVEKKDHRKSFVVYTPVNHSDA